MTSPSLHRSKQRKANKMCHDSSICWGTETNQRSRSWMHYWESSCLNWSTASYCLSLNKVLFLDLLRQHLSHSECATGWFWEDLGGFCLVSKKGTAECACKIMCWRQVTSSGRQMCQCLDHISVFIRCQTQVWILTLISNNDSYLYDECLGLHNSTKRRYMQSLT